MNNLDKQYTDLLQDILDNGVEKKDRTGTGTLSVFGRQIRHKMSDGFPLLTTKKMYWKGIVTELLWFLRGDTNIQSLVQNNCHIWDGDAYKNYLKNRDSFSNRDNVKEDVVINGMNGSSNRAYTMEEFINTIRTNNVFAERWGELGPVYGKQWRSWDRITYNDEHRGGFHNPIDQIANLINDLKTNPDSRRLMVNAYNVGELDQMVLPPCHYGFQVYTRELSLEERMNLIKGTEHTKIIVAFCENPSDTWLEGQVDIILDQQNIPTRAISLMFNMRSNDVPLGLPFNLASYGLLLSILGEIVNMVPDELIANLGDAHIYLNQIDGVTEQLKRNSFDLPTLRINTEFWPTKSEECGIGELTDNINFLIKEMRIDDFQIENYKSHPSIKMPLSN